MENLKNKAPMVINPKITLEKMLDNAQAKASEVFSPMLKDCYENVKNLKSEMQIIDVDEYLWPDNKQDIYCKAFDFRGIGLTVNYPMVSALASSLCEFIQECDTLDIVKIKLMISHVDAIIWVLNEQIEGDENKQVEKILIDLREARKMMKNE